MSVEVAPVSSRLLDTTEATERLGVSRSTLERARRDGALRVIKLGKLTRYSEADLNDFIQLCREGRWAGRSLSQKEIDQQVAQMYQEIIEPDDSKKVHIEFS
jgi:excisionase family DNA binding protein